jgi:hypothetical protein
MGCVPSSEQPLSLTAPAGPHQGGTPSKQTKAMSPLVQPAVLPVLEAKTAHRECIASVRPRTVGRQSEQRPSQQINACYTRCTIILKHAAVCVVHCMRVTARNRCCAGQLYVGNVAVHIWCDGDTIIHCLLVWGHAICMVTTAVTICVLSVVPQDRGLLQRPWQGCYLRDITRIQRDPA